MRHLKGSFSPTGRYSVDIQQKGNFSLEFLEGTFLWSHTTNDIYVNTQKLTAVAFYKIKGILMANAIYPRYYLAKIRQLGSPW